MESLEIKTYTQVYNYEALEAFFEEISDPQETARHIDHLLHFLVYYEHKEGLQEHYNIYSEIFELKQVLQTMIRQESHGNN
jgi:hypothetical protein